MFGSSHVYTILIEKKSFLQNWNLFLLMTNPVFPQLFGKSQVSVEPVWHFFWILLIKSINMKIVFDCCFIMLGDWDWWLICVLDSIRFKMDATWLTSHCSEHKWCFNILLKFWNVISLGRYDMQNGEGFGGVWYSWILVVPWGRQRLSWSAKVLLAFTDCK